MKWSFQRMKGEWTRGRWSSKSGWGGGGLRVNGGDDRENPARLGDFSPIVLCCLGGDVKKVYC